MDSADQRHEEAVSWYREIDDELATTPLVVAEADHLASARAGIDALKAYRNDLTAGAYLIEWWPTAVKESVDVANRYADSGVSLTDASIVALAARLDTESIATFDERHFRTLRPLKGGSVFKLLPADK